jgi:protoporphyrinogen oxidase
VSVTETKKPIPVILGAGLAGLSCAHRLSSQGIKVLVLEKEAIVGGLAASRETQGLSYDYGPHRFHSKRQPVINLLKELMGENLIVQKRKSEIFMNDRFFIYPLNTKNILKNMPPLTLARCFYDYVAARMSGFFNSNDQGSFESWVTKRFGKTLYRIFFGTYTHKVLGLPPRQISKDWAQERINLLSLWSTMQETLFRSQGPARAYANHFYYPKEGGIGRIAERLKEKILRSGSQVLLNARIKQIFSEKKEGQRTRIRSVMFESGGQAQKVDVTDLLSTIPMTELPELLADQELLGKKEVFENLKFRSLIFFYLVLDTGSFSDSQWIYLPEEGFFSNRISEPKNFSKHGFPADRTVICAEISCNYGDDTWELRPEKIHEKILQDIAKLGLQTEKAEKARDFFCHKVRYSYPVYQMNYRDHVAAARRLLDPFENLVCFGRNGSFKYGNMDDVIAMGLETAERYLKNHRTDGKP